MVNVTNKLGLPEYLVDWLNHDSYDHNKAENTISATGLMKPVKISILTARHKEKLEIDVSELIASRMGTAIHDSIERISTPNFSKEQRITRVLRVKEIDFTVTGKYDVLQKNGDGTVTIRDIKTTSVWAYIFGGKDEDYRIQLSIYRWLLSQTEEVTSIAFIDFFFTDWQSMKAKTEANYPSQRLKAGYKVDLLSLEDTEKYIVERLTMFLDFRDVEDDDLPDCTPKELWAGVDTWALVKIGNKRATKICDSLADAEAYKNLHSSDLTIRLRPGKVKRCGYCPVHNHCSQHKRLVESGQIE